MHRKNPLVPYFSEETAANAITVILTQSFHRVILFIEEEMFT